MPATACVTPTSYKHAALPPIDLSDAAHLIIGTWSTSTSAPTRNESRAPHQAFHAPARVFAAAPIYEGNRLIAKPGFEVMYQPGHGSVADVVVAELIRLIDDTDFGEGMPTQTLVGRVV